MALHSVVKDEARVLRLLEKRILSAGIKKESPAELVVTKASVKTSRVLGKLDCRKSLSNDSTRACRRRGNFLVA